MTSQKTTKITFAEIIYWVMILFPFAISAYFYNRLPEQVAIHFSANSQPDNYAPKWVAAWILPLIFVVVSILVTFGFRNDPKHENIKRSKEMSRLARWSIAILGIVSQLLTMLFAVGIELKIDMIVSILLAIIFILIGNYLPKCHSNFVMGIRTPWTLASEENWNNTHRISGYLWIFGGVLLLVNTIFLEQNTVIAIAVILAMVLIPFIYSYIYYAKNEKSSKNF